MLQTRYVHTWVSLAMTRRSMDPGQVWSFLVVLVGGGRGLMGISYFEDCLIFQVGDCSQVSLWGSNLRVRNPEISQVAKLSIQVHFLQEFQCCFPGGTVLVLRKKHDSSESTGARLFHRISRFWSLEALSGIKHDNGKCRSPKLIKRGFNMFQWEIIKKMCDFSFPCLEKHTHTQTIAYFWDVHAIELWWKMVLFRHRVVASRHNGFCFSTKPPWQACHGSQCGHCCLYHLVI
jgi:hypothetical protein